MIDMLLGLGAKEAAKAAVNWLKLEGTDEVVESIPDKRLNELHPVDIAVFLRDLLVNNDIERLYRLSEMKRDSAHKYCPHCGHNLIELGTVEVLEDNLAAYEQDGSEHLV